MMRIAFFHNLPSGGAKRAHYEQIKRLSKNHKIDLYTMRGSDEKYFPLDEFIEKKFEFELEEIQPSKFSFLLNPMLPLLRLYRLEKIAKKIAKKINLGNYDIAYVTYGLPTPAPSILKYLKIPSIYYCHEPPRRFYEPQFASQESSSFSLKSKLAKFSYVVSAEYFSEYLFKKIDKRNIKFAKKVFTSSFYNKQRIEKIYGIIAEVLYLGVDTEKFIPQGIPKKNVVVSVGALHFLKGHDFVIESLSLLKNPPKLIIVADRGNENEEEKLKNLARSKNIEIEILKKISDEKLIEIYNEAKITLCAQILEPFGLVPLESMACSTPVVAIKEGGFTESIIDGKTGILTERDKIKFSKAIQLLLENEDLAREYGKEGRRYVVEKWSWEKTIENLEKGFERCLSNHLKRQP